MKQERMGKVVFFDSYYGTIKEEKDCYLFSKYDMVTPIQVGDFVSFRKEEIGKQKVARFVKKRGFYHDQQKMG